MTSFINWDNFDSVVSEARKLAQEKNKLYGVKNLLLFDGLSILVRMNDKISRLNKMFEMNTETTQKLAHDSINDSLLDIINYSIYLYLYKNKLLLKE